MRKKKKERLKIETFWANFCYFNVPEGQQTIPVHLPRVNFRLGGVSDEGVELMTGYIKSIDQLDLDETSITNESIRYLTRLDSIKELRLKGCRQIDNDCLEHLYEIKGLKLLHLGGTSITVEGLKDIGRLKHLKTLLISADADEMEKLAFIAVQLPANCEFIINHESFDRYNSSPLK